MSPDGLKKPPPEEKLLRLIRGKDAAAEARPSTESGEPSAGGAAGWAARADTGRRPWVRWLAAGLGAALAVELLLIVAALRRPAPTLELPAEEASSSPIELAGVTAAAPSLVASASAGAFAIPEVEQRAAVDVVPVRRGPSEAAKALAARLTLSGIVAGDPPQAVIEDTQTQRTYFATVGRPVVDGAVLEEVGENRAILDLDGEKIELAL